MPQRTHRFDLVQFPIRSAAILAARSSVADPALCWV